MIASVVGETYEEHAVDVVYVAVLPSTVMNIVLRHSDFGSVENRRLKGSRVRWLCSMRRREPDPHLVHVVPDEHSIRGFLPAPTRYPLLVNKTEQALPPFSTGGIEEIDPSGTAAPAPAFVVFLVSLLDD